MKTLIEDYERRLNSIQEMIEKLQFKDDANPDYVRLTTKRAEYRTIIAELKRELNNFKEKVFDTLIKFAPEVDAIEVQKHIIHNFG